MSNSIPEYKPEKGHWKCYMCNIELRQTEMQVNYLGNVFEVSLLQCPCCGQALVPKKLAYGKMAEVEELLEEK